MKRIVAIDYMRAVALMLIILAHVNAPSLLQEIRCFDVVMLVFLSGLSYRVSQSGKKIEYGKYLWKRIKKLLIPTYILLTLIFVITFFITKSFEPYGLIKIIQSYLLYDGIGYVWFVRVTLMLALISPLVLHISEKTTSFRSFMFTALAWSLIYCLFVWIYKTELIFYWGNLFLYLYPVYLLGYGLVYFIGVHYTKLSKKEKLTIFIILFVLYTLMKLFTDKTVAQDKYPPGLLYTSYGLLITFAVYEVLDSLKINRCPKWVLSISKNSFTIYLFHIVPILILKYVDSPVIIFIKSNFIIEYTFVLTVAFLMLLLYKKSGDLIKKRVVKEG